MVRKVTFLSYNMTTKDSNSPDGKVPLGRQFDFIGDAETELMILNDGDESLCLGYEDVKVYEEVFVGDMLEYRATMTNVGNSSRDCKIEVYKLAESLKNKDDNYKPGAMRWFDKPVLCTSGNVRLVVKKHLQRGEQPSGEVIDPWRSLDDFPEEDVEF